MIQDAQGHALSGATADAAAACDAAVRAFNLVCGDAIGQFDAARDAAPQFVMAHLGKAWVLAVANDPKLLVQARELADGARAMPQNARERAHSEALVRSRR